MANESRYSRSSTKKAVIDRLYLTSLLAALSIVGVAWLDTVLKAPGERRWRRCEAGNHNETTERPRRESRAVLVSYQPTASPARNGTLAVCSRTWYQAKSDRRARNWVTRVYFAGESFFEPPGGEHLISENASAREPASLLAIFIAGERAQLSTAGN